ncbi:MAG: hypothetical protein F2942_03880 [Actinobacteria bacterium]|uniref:Unannotated protein n=1 Tax=freshwater metagenome TaxID=449393 RepID=A0A6J7UJU2_9ZZZZ|nr:hypothetical protein [Actinomycetota bacterium]
MPNSVYPQPLSLHAEADSPIAFLGTLSGPAGSSLIEYPDGTILEVDHLQPAQLVQISLTGSIAGSELLLHLIGEQRVAEAIDWIELGSQAPKMLSADDYFYESPPDDQALYGQSADYFAAFGSAGSIQRGSGSRKGSTSRAAAEIGNLVRTADFLGDTRLEPLERLLAGAEFLVQLDTRSSVQMFRPFQTQVVSAMADLAPQVSREELTELSEGPDQLLQSAIGNLLSVSNQFPELKFPLEPLLRELEDLQRFEAPAAVEFMNGLVSANDYEDDDQAAAPLRSVRPEPALMRHERTVAIPPQVPEDYRKVEQLPSGLFRLSVSSAFSGQWVRALRKEGFLLLASAPLLPNGLLLSADLLIPPDLDEESIEFEVVEKSVLTGQPRQLDLIREAITAGRNATSAARLGNAGSAAEHWEECGDLWEKAGDSRRATLAFQLAQSTFYR